MNRAITDSETLCERRTVLRNGGTVIAIGAAGGLAGCLGTTPDSRHLELVETEASPTVWGNIEVTARVRNDGQNRESGELFAEATVDGETYQGSKSISVGAGETRTFEVTIDTPITGMIAADEITLEAWVEE